MALKDLASDLSAYKGQTTPTSIDSQINSGVDFFPNDDASGFTPKTNLESLYNQAREGNIAQTWPEAAPTNDKTRQAFGQQGEYGVPDNVGRAVPSFLLNTDTLLGVRVQPQLLSPFLETPIANAVSFFYNENPFSVTLGTKSDPIRGDERFNKRTYYYSGRQPAGLNGDFPFIPNGHGSDFMVTPLGDTSFSNPSDSLTHNISMIDLTGPTTETYQTSINIEPSIPNAHKIAVVNTDANKTFDVTTMDDMVYGGYNLPTQKSSAGSATIKIIHNKRRGVYNEMVNTFFEHQPFPLFQAPNVSYTDERYFSENNGKSIHISPGGELNAGFRYGAYQSEQFVNFNPGNQLTDVISEAPTTVGLGDRYSTYSNYPHINAEVPSNLIVGNETILPKWPDRASTNLLSPAPGGYGVRNYVLSAAAADLGKVQTGFNLIKLAVNNPEKFREVVLLRSKTQGRFEFSDGIFTNNTFKNVPAGLNENNKFGTKKYREVANSGPFEGNDNHPLILRDIGNQWGGNRDGQGFIEGLDEAAGGFVRGAPTLTGLIDRNITDKFRIGKFLLTAPGLSFIGKQFVLQGLNPTLETKVWNPTSILGLVGAGRAYEEISDIVSAALGSAISGNSIAEVFAGLSELATTIAFPIGHPERHFGGGRYEDVVPLGKDLPKFIKDFLPSGMDTVLSPIDFSKKNTGFGSRIAMQSNPEVVKQTTIDFGFGPLSYEVEFGGKDLATSMLLMNPNKYLFPISSAPKSIDKGVPSFTGTTDVLRTDVRKIQNEPGGTFNKSTSNSEIEGGNNSELVTRHSTLSYERLRSGFGYTDANENRILSPQEVDKYIDGSSETLDFLIEKRKYGKDIVKGTGDAGASEVLGDGILNGMGDRLGEKAGEALGVTKGNTTSANVDKLNIIPIVDGNGTYGEEKPDVITDNPDFIKFRFRDIINNKFLVFRAILDGISDTVTPEYNPLEYIGRPDKLYTYKGVDRDISFNFKVYPKTKQELPVLMEKMNYLIGMCYPSYTDRERMVAPYMELTLGDMFVDAPGILTGLTITVEEATTWEIEEGLQYPHFISAQCTFKYIGKYTPVALGKFYDIPWLSDNRQINQDGSQGKPVGTFTENPAIKSKNLAVLNSSNVPYRRSDVYDYRWINTITGNSQEDGRPPAQQTTTE